MLWATGNVIATWKSRENTLYRWVQFIVCMGLTLNTLVSIYIIETGNVLSWVNQALSWGFIGKYGVRCIICTITHYGTENK